MRKKHVFVFLAASTFFYACQQEVPDIITSAQQCRIETGYYDNDQDSANFIYDASGRLVKHAGPDGFYLYSYSGDRITTRQYLDTVFNETLYLDSVFYDAGGRIAEVRTADFRGWITDTLVSKYVYQYENNRLSKLLYIESWNTGSGIIQDTFPSVIHWNAAGNIEKLVYIDNFGDPVDSIQYQYDANPNYFKAVHPHFYLFDPRIRMHVGLEVHFAYYYSKNNVINSNIYGAFDNPVTYGHDSTNKLAKVEMNGIEYARYRYRCP